MVKEKLHVWTYNHKDGLKYGTSSVSSQVGVTEKCTQEGEDEDCACPFTNIICCIGIVVAKYSGEEQY